MKKLMVAMVMVAMALTVACEDESFYFQEIQGMSCDVEVDGWYTCGYEGNTYIYECVDEKWKKWDMQDLMDYWNETCPNCPYAEADHPRCYSYQDGEWEGVQIVDADDPDTMVWGYAW